MEFLLSQSSRSVGQSVTGYSYDRLLRLPLHESGKADSRAFAPFRDRKAREIPPRGSVLLLLKLVMKLEDASRRFFHF